MTPNNGSGEAAEIIAGRCTNQTGANLRKPEQPGEFVKRNALPPFASDDALFPADRHRDDGSRPAVCLQIPEGKIFSVTLAPNGVPAVAIYQPQKIKVALRTACKLAAEQKAALSLAPIPISRPNTLPRKRHGCCHGMSALRSSGWKKPAARSRSGLN